jgi:hypothetical protein
VAGGIFGGVLKSVMGGVEGIEVPSCVGGVRELVTAEAMLNKSLLFAIELSKFVPVIETAVPTVPMFGVKLVMVGSPFAVPAVKFALLVAVPFGATTLMGPVVAPVGTLAVICVVVALITVAVVPLN